MRTNEENFLMMVRTVNSVVKNHATQWSGVKKFKEAAEVLSNFVLEIGDVSANAKIETTGATVDKHRAREKAVDFAIKLSKRACAYAIEKENMELHDQIQVSSSSLTQQHHAATLAKLKDIHKRILPLAAELTDYGVSVVDISTLAKLITDYETLMAKPRVLVTTRKSINISIPKMITNIRKTLDKMDNLINIFDTGNFEAEYLNARIVLNLGSRHEQDLEEEKPKEPKPDEDKNDDAPVKPE